jgi:hypothetical protein
MSTFTVHDTVLVSSVEAPIALLMMISSCYENKNFMKSIPGPGPFFKNVLKSTVYGDKGANRSCNRYWYGPSMSESVWYQYALLTDFYLKFKLMLATATFAS